MEEKNSLECRVREIREGGREIGDRETQRERVGGGGDSLRRKRTKEKKRAAHCRAVGL